jgi:hypothetical protein
VARSEAIAKQRAEAGICHRIPDCRDIEIDWKESDLSDEEWEAKRSLFIRAGNWPDAKQ